jgi:hypothetical protein
MGMFASRKKRCDSTLLGERTTPRRQSEPCRHPLLGRALPSRTVVTLRRMQFSAGRTPQSVQYCTL